MLCDQGAKSSPYSFHKAVLPWGIIHSGIPLPNLYRDIKYTSRGSSTLAFTLIYTIPEFQLLIMHSAFEINMIELLFQVFVNIQKDSKVIYVVK